jgi:8-oxo-dGTP pyrophosphatase MutT (NUDIX family)
MNGRDIAMVFVENSSGLLQVHLRAKNKKMFPSRYGLGAAGGINKGETPIEAARRELEEELGIKPEIEELFMVEFFSKDYDDKVYLFRAKYDGEVKPCKREFQWSKWMCRESIDYLTGENLLCYDTNLAYNYYKLFCSN